MSALAVRTGSLNLGQGFPDRLDLDPGSEVVVTAGATEAIAAAILAFVDPGDEMVVLEPFYDSYVACIEMAGGVRRPVTLHAPDFRLDVDALRAAVTPRTRTLLLNTPHNPTGTVLTREELEAVAQVAVENDLVVITDEVYEHLVFDGRQHVPLCTLPGMWERTVSISSAGKTFSFTGWKVGWVSGPAELVATVQSAKQWLTFSNAAPLQPAVAHALSSETAFYESLAKELESKRDLLVDGLRALDMEVYPPEATYFVTTDVRAYGYPDAMAFCLALPARAGVVAIPSQVFYDDQDEGRHKVRWAFCKETSVVAEGVRRLREADLRA
jgi:N-succinyldiaminopimelate aminotransferase